MNIRFTLISLYSVNNLGVRYLSAYLRSRGIDVSVIFFKDMFVNNAEQATQKEIDILIDTLKNTNPCMAGMSLTCSALFKTAKKLTREIHDRLGIPVIWGGAHATILPEECIKEADFVCAGEGEAPVHKLLTSSRETQNNFLSIPNLWLKNNGAVVSNKMNPIDNTFCTLPFPDYSGDNKCFINRDSVKYCDPFKEEPWVYATVTSKGCKYLCTYCSNDYIMKASGGKKNYIRRRCPEHVIEELVTIRKEVPGIRMIHFVDDEFTSDEDWVTNFCRLYKEKVNLPFFCCYHPFGVNDRSIKHLKNAGLTHVQMGIQSGSARVRKKIYHRPESNEAIAKAVGLLNKYGVTPTIDLIFDNPFEEEADKKEAVKFFLELQRPFHCHLFSLLYFPKTRLTERALKEKVITEEDVEGQTEKALSQLVITREYDRRTSELFWISVISLTGKKFVPKFLIKWLSESEKLKNNPKPLWYFANIANLIRLGQNGIAAALRGQLTFSFMKKYLSYFAKLGS